MISGGHTLIVGVTVQPIPPVISIESTRPLLSISALACGSVWQEAVVGMEISTRGGTI